MHCDPNEYMECKVAYWIWRTVPPLHLLIGTIGNLINVIILLRYRIRQYSTSLYLLFLAFADLTLLWTSTFVEMYKSLANIDVANVSNFLCKVLPWVNYASATYSIWLLVILTLERAIMTRSFVFARTKMTPRNAVLVSFILLLFCAFSCSHYFGGLGLVQVASNSSTPSWKCIALSEGLSHFYTYYWPVIIFVGFNIIPTVIIIIGNIGIVFSVVQQKRKLQRVNPTNTVQNECILKKRKTMTKLLFLICGFFIVTTLPYTFYNVLARRTEANDELEEARKDMYVAILLNLAYCNFTFNFFFYFVSGTLFKQEWKAFVGETVRRIRRLCLRDTQETDRNNTLTLTRRLNA